MRKIFGDQKAFDLREQKVSLYKVLRQSVKTSRWNQLLNKFGAFKVLQQIAPFSITFWIARFRRDRRHFLGIKATLKREKNVWDSGDYLPGFESENCHQDIAIDNAIGCIPPRCPTFPVCSFHYNVREIHVEKSAAAV